MKISSHLHVVSLAAFLTGMPVISLAANSTPQPLQLLRDLAAQASATQTTADDFEAATSALGMSWQAKSDMLATLKTEVNTMGRTLASLENVRDSAQPFEQKAIDDAASLLKSVASDTTAAIAFINDNPNGLWLRQFSDDASKLAKDATKLSGTLNESVRLAKAKNEEQRLERDLGLQASSR